MSAIRACFAIATLQVACGHFGFERQALTGDGGSDGGSRDAIALDDAGNPIGSFGSPSALVPLNSQYDEFGPTLTEDLLEICFISNREGTFAVYCSVRGNQSDPWPSPARSVVSASESPESVGLSADGLTMYLGLVPISSSDQDLLVSTRTARTNPWSVPVPLSEVSRPSVDDFDPQPTPDHLGLWYVSKDSSYLTNQLHRASRTAVGSSWSAGSLVNELIDAEKSLSSPAASANGSVYFVKAFAGLGEADIYRATGNPLIGYSQPEAVSELNTSNPETGVWISPDQRSVVFNRYENGYHDLYMATR